MKLRLIAIFCLLICLTGCVVSVGEPIEGSTTMDSTPAEVTTEQETPPSSSDVTENTTIPTDSEAESESPEMEALEAVEAWLEKDLSFRIYQFYDNFPMFGYSQETKQEQAADGSFHFLVLRKQWDQSSEQEHSEKMEYYYQYEDGALVCYLRANDGEPESSVLPPAVQAQMERDKSLMYRAEALLPSYLEDLSIVDESCITFRLPVERVLESGTLLDAHIQNTFLFSGASYEADTDLSIACTLTVEPDTLRPVKLTYDFTELKPYVLSDGALSAEYAIGMNLMELNYEFDFDLPETVSVPEDFLP